MLNCSSFASKMRQVLTSMARILVKLTSEIIIFMQGVLKGNFQVTHLQNFAPKKNITRLL